MVIPGEATEELGQPILTMSPAGYFRWRTTKGHAERVVGKLRQMRSLEQARPRNAVVRLPSLFELRQEFAVALTAGDLQAAEGAVAAIDRRQLDSADNTLFMRIRLWGRFGDFTRIVTYPDLDRLVSVRMPHRIRLSILEAFHTHFLAPLEEQGKSGEALKQYASRIHDVLSGLIALASAADPLPARRLLGYRACVLRDAHQARELLSGPADLVLTDLLSTLAKEGEQPAPTLEAQFLEARKRLDWKAVQELGEALIADHPEYVPILRRSLEFRPNQALRSALDARGEKAPTGAAPPAAPRTWPEWLALLRSNESALLEAFLEDRDQGAAEGLGSQDVQRLCDGLEELYTDPAIGQDARLRRTLMSGLVELVDDFVKEPGFPRADLADVYLGLFRLWGSLKRGSVYPPDCPGAPRTRRSRSSVRQVRRNGSNRPPSGLVGGPTGESAPAFPPGDGGDAGPARVQGTVREFLDPCRRFRARRPRRSVAGGALALAPGGGADRLRRRYARRVRPPTRRERRRRSDPAGGPGEGGDRFAARAAGAGGRGTPAGAVRRAGRRRLGNAPWSRYKERACGRCRALRLVGDDPRGVPGLRRCGQETLCLRSGDRGREHRIGPGAMDRQAGGGSSVGLAKKDVGEVTLREEKVGCYRVKTECEQPNRKAIGNVRGTPPWFSWAS